jgi:glycosyltransferase involved in cell wall biosynthesis
VFSDEMPAQIQECSIFVLPSRSEAMGRVLVEAMAAGKARIGANVDGIPTVIEDGVDGLLFRVGDAADLSLKMQMLMTDSRLRHTLAKAAKNRA